MTKMNKKQTIKEKKEKNKKPAQAMKINRKSRL